MEDLYVNAFFKIEQETQLQLFEDCLYAWEALGKIEEFFEKISLKPIDPAQYGSVYLVNPESIFIGKGTVIEPGAYICGPCFIGENCEVRHGAYIRGSVIIGDDCIIGHDTEIKRSILLNNVSAAHFNYIGDSILGNNVNLGAGVKLANLRLDQGTVSVSFQGEHVPTNLSKLGAIIGDGAKLGCNAVTNPGALIGMGAFCHPCLCIGGYVPPKAKVKSTHKNMIREYVDTNSF